jgi:hypothetical protein
MYHTRIYIHQSNFYSPVIKICFKSPPPPPPIVVAKGHSVQEPIIEHEQSWIVPTKYVGWGCVNRVLLLRGDDGGVEREDHSNFRNVTGDELQKNLVLLLFLKKEFFFFNLELYSRKARGFYVPPPPTTALDNDITKFCAMS